MFPLRESSGIAPKGSPPAISQKLGEAIKKVTLEPSFQKVLVSFDVPYDYLDQKGLEKKSGRNMNGLRFTSRKWGSKPPPENSIPATQEGSQETLTL